MENMEQLINNLIFFKIILIERCAEWNVELWMGSVDFEKAFDSIEHEALWQVLPDQGVDDDHIDFLTVLYNNQTACVTAGANSRDFPVGRGVKQGDPISALLFIDVMKTIFRNWKQKWNTLNKRIMELSSMSQRTH